MKHRDDDRILYGPDGELAKALDALKAAVAAEVRAHPYRTAAWFLGWGAVAEALAWWFQW